MREIRSYSGRVLGDGLFAGDQVGGLGHGVGTAGGSMAGHDECMLEHLGQALHRDEVDLLLDLGIDFVEVGGVLFGDQHSGDTFAEGGHALFLQAADGQHIAVQSNLAGHG